MEVTVVRDHDNTNRLVYPCLKIADDGDIALFVAPNTCVVLAGTGTSDKGHFTTSMNEEVFEPFNGVVELSN